MKNFKTSSVFDTDIYSFFQAKRKNMVLWSDQSGLDGLLDRSGYGNHASKAGTLSYQKDAIGRENASFEFDGGALVNFGDNDLFSFVDSGDKPFSIFFRFFDPGSPNTVHTPIAKAVSATEGEYYILLSSGSVVFRLIDEANGASIGMKTRNNLIEPSKWYDVLCVYDGSGLTSGLKIYVNGHESAQDESNVNSGYVSMQNTARDFLIGGRGSTQRFTGGVCDVRLFAEELTQKDARDLGDSIW